MFNYSEMKISTRCDSSYQLTKTFDAEMGECVDREKSGTRKEEEGNGRPRFKCVFLGSVGVSLGQGFTFQLRGCSPVVGMQGGLVFWWCGGRRLVRLGSAALA